MTHLLFLLFSTGAWISAALVLRSKNPVHAVFYLVSVFLHSSGLLCLLGLEYFALLQLLVYVGALAIMFLFVVMLLDIPVTEIVSYQRGTYPAAGILMVMFLVALFFAASMPSENRVTQIPMIGTEMSTQNQFVWTQLQHGSNLVAQLGVAIYGVHVDLLILRSLILLVAMVGAVALTLKRRVSAPMYDVFAQHHRDFEKVVCMVSASMTLLKEKHKFFNG